MRPPRHGPPRHPVGNTVPGSGAKPPGGAAAGRLAAVGGPSPSGHLGLAGHLCGRSEQLGPPRNPRGKKAPLPRSRPLPPAAVRGPPQKPYSCQLCQSGTVWCRQPISRPPECAGGGGEPRPPPGSLPHPRCQAAGGCLRRGGCGGGVAHAAPLHPCRAGMCTSVPQHGTRRHEAALALFFIGLMAAALAWPWCRQCWGQQGGGGGGPHPCPLSGSPLCPGLGRGQGLGRGRC